MKIEEIHERSIDLVTRFSRMATGEQTAVVANSVYYLVLNMLHTLDREHRLAFVEAIFESAKEIDGEPNETDTGIH